MNLPVSDHILGITFPHIGFNDWCTVAKERELRHLARERGITDYQLRANVEPGIQLVALRMTRLTEDEVRAWIEEHGKV